MEKLFDWGLKLFILIAPTIYISVRQSRVVQMIFFILFTSALFGISMFCKPKRKFNNIWVGLFLAWNVLLVCIHDPQKIPLAFFNVMIGCLLYYLIFTYADNIKSICRMFLIVALINFPLVIFQLFRFDPIFTSADNAIPAQTIYGFFAFSNHLGLYMGIITPIVLFFSGWLGLLLGFMVIASRCFTGNIVFFISIIFFIGVYVDKYRKYVFSVVSLLLIILLFSPALSGKIFLKNEQKMSVKALAIKLDGRIKIWDRTLRLALVNPYYGRGLDSFAKESPVFTQDISHKIWDTPQNDYLHLCYEQGFIATLVLLGGYLLNLFRNFWQARQDKLTFVLFLSACSILISMFPQYFLYIPRLITAVIVIMALFEARINDITKGEERLCI